MPNGLFVTASDTGVGKTHVACELLRLARHRGLVVAARKPVESGCPPGAQGLLAQDARALAAAAGEEDDRRVTAWRFERALAPDQAARAMGHELKLAELEEAVFAGLEGDEFLIVEGAGGLCSPIARDGLNLDLAQRLGLPLLIVVPDRLGAINQALLSLKTAEAAGLAVRAILLNPQQPAALDALPLNNAQALRRRVSVPVLQGCFAQPLTDLPEALFD